MSLLFMLIVIIISIIIIIAALYVLYPICIFIIGSVIILFEVISGKKSKEDWKQEMEAIKKREELKKVYYAKKKAEKNKQDIITGTISFDKPISNIFKMKR